MARSLTAQKKGARRKATERKPAKAAPRPVAKPVKRVVKTDPEKLKAALPERPACLVPTCDREARSRGLCINDYNKACRLVREGKTSWEKLERQGKVHPPGKVRLPSAAERHFLGGDSKKGKTKKTA